MSTVDDFSAEISMIQDADLPILFGKRIQLFPYQIEFIRHILEGNCVCVIKARCTGYTSAYLLHVLFRLYRMYLEDRVAYDDAGFVIVSQSGAASKNASDFIKRGLHLFSDAKFVLTVMDHIKFLSPGTIKTGLIGHRRMDIDEVFFDEYMLFPAVTDLSLLQYSFHIKKIVGVTTMGNNKSPVQKFINEFSKNNPDVIFTPWYECPLHNKNLKWERLGIVYEEPTIDEEGNVEYNREKWRKMVSEFWNPTNEWFEKINPVLGPSTEQELNCKNGKRIFF